MKSLTSSQIEVFYKNAGASLSKIQAQNKAAFEIIGSVMEDEKTTFTTALKKGKSRHLQDLIDKFTATLKPGKPIDIRTAIREGLSSEDAADHELLREIESIPARLSLGRKSEQPLEKHSILNPYVRSAKLYKLGDVAGIPSQRIDALVMREMTYKGLTEKNVKSLIEGNVLTETEGKRIQFITDLYQLLDEDLELTSSIAKSRLTKKENIATLRDLSILSLEKWQQLLKDSPNVNQQHVGTLARRFQGVIAKRFPGHSFYHRLIEQGSIDIAGTIRDIDFDLLKQAGYKFGRSTAITLRKRLAKLKDKEHRSKVERAQLFINLYPGLDVEEILNEPTRSGTEKAKAIASRIEGLLRFFERNVDRDYLVMDMTPAIDDKGGATRMLNWEGIGESLRRLILRSLKTYQRVFAVAGEVELSLFLMRQGFHSAADIADLRASWLQGAAHISKERAVRLINRARWIFNAATAAAGAVLDMNTGPFTEMWAFHDAPAVRSYVERFEGYQQLLGAGSYCKCIDCESILSPAAYFVDLLNFVETRILNESLIAESNDLHLKKRRLDLWKLPLTCNNSKNLVPYLSIVNEILENFIAIAEGFDENQLYLPMDDDLNSQGRSAVEDLVYGKLKDAEATIHQPFVLPLAELNAYLKNFAGRYSRFDVAEALGVPRSDVIRVYFGTSQRNLNLIAIVKSIGFLRSLFDFNFVVTSGVIEPVDAQVFLKALDISREDFGNIVNTRFISPTNTNRVRIVLDKRDPATDVQNNIETVVGLTAAKLDMVHRFARLARMVEWNINEIDAFIDALSSRGLIDGISGDWTDGTGNIHPGLTYFLMILQLIKDKRHAECEELLALVHQLTQRTTSERPALFDRIFNLPQYVQRDGTFPKPSTTFVHPYFNNAAVAPGSDSTLQRLLAGLTIDGADLFRLINHLHTALNVNVDGGFQLSVENLTLLYRHVLIARWYQLSIDELFQLIAISGQSPGGYISGLVDFERVEQFHDWLTAAFKNAMVAQANTLATYDAIVNQNLAGLPERYQPSRIVGSVVEKIRMDSASIEAANISMLFPQYLANELAMSEEAIVAIVSFTGENYSNPNLVNELNGDTGTSDVVALVEAIIPWVLILEGESSSPELIQFIHDHPAPDFFDFNDSTGTPQYLAITHSRLQVILAYKALVPSKRDDYTSADLIRVLSNFTVVEKFRTAGSPNDLAILGRVIGEEVPMSPFLKGILPNNAPRALRLLKTLREMAGELSLTIDQLGSLISDDYAQLRSTSLAMLSSFRSKYPKEAQYLDKIEPVQNAINELRRDALLDYLIRSTTLQCDTPNGIYAHFLIDTAMSGCARTSRVIASISSLQLFVHRCLLSQEGDLSTDERIQVEDEAKEEWIWRKNFRVWQANRKVFLYPETYIEPNLRHNKTPLFRDLEEELLQKEISEQNVLDAYSRYVKGFEEVNELKIVGAYNDVSLTGVGYRVHFVGATDSDPVQFFYRSAEKIQNIDRVIWQAWERINIEIPVSQVSPVVMNNRLYILWIEFNSYSHNELRVGTSEFRGYRHRTVLKLSYRRIDGTWSPPQQVSLRSVEGDAFEPATAGVILDDLVLVLPAGLGRPTYGDVVHDRPKDGYTLNGFHWKKIFPDVLSGGARGNRLAVAAADWNIWHTISFRDLSVRPIPSDFDTMLLLSSWTGEEFFTYGESPAGNKTLALRKSVDLITYHKRELFLEEARRTIAENHNAAVATILENEVPAAERPDLQIATNNQLLSEEPEFLAINGLRSGVIVQTDKGNYAVQVHSDDRYHVERLNTTTIDEISGHLHVGGFTGLLAREHQSLTEANPFIPNNHPRLSFDITSSSDYTGAMGTYFREIYFHIPFLVANHLNSQHKFAEAQRWYHFIFDPTSNPLLDPSDTDAQREAKLRDRVWRYREFVGQDIPTLRSILTNASQIELYKGNPFNPYAIADVRIHTYQKAIVMKYVDNLLDWGDSLFSQDSMESIGEATLLYVMAADILGERPRELGACELSNLNPRNYEAIMDNAVVSSEFLLEMENVITSAGLDFGSSTNGSLPPEPSNPGASIVRQAPVFCVPPNKDLIGYWDRLDKQLGKIRNCMNIDGIRRQISLLAPEIDPAILVRAVAEGLSLEDAITSLTSSVPPYRCRFLLNLARNHVALLQQFGNGLLGALEKKDAEELNRLRTTHEKNVLALSKAVNDKEVASAQESVTSLEARKNVTQFRVGHFDELIKKGVNKNEQAERDAQKASFGFRSKSQLMGMMSSIAHLMPQLGAPTAITFGGVQIGGSLSAWSTFYAFRANEKDLAANSAGMEAGFTRREEDWKYQLATAEKELAQVEKDIRVAKIRMEIAERNRAIYQRTVEQNQEILEYYGDKFTGLGLYAFMAKAVQTIYRQCYNVVLATTRQAEQAYHFENVDPEVYIRPTYWDAGHAGLLAGDKLALDLQRLEDQFIRTGFRKIEIGQSFSLLQLNPEALLDLKLEGECDFGIPEIYFDLAYPGHFKRRIRSVQLTIPCITGPYTSVSAHLSLVQSFVRTDADGGAVAVPYTHTARIATSSAQNDSGQFQLNFTDDQYAPFEGAGAISEWNLRLPKTFRQFDYKTISDVIVRINYTAEYNEALRAKIDSSDTSELRSLKSVLTDLATSLLRLLNLRHDFGNEFHKLMHSNSNTKVTVAIGKNFFPPFFNESNVVIESIHLILEISKNQTATGFEVDINGTTATVTSSMSAERHDLDVTAAFGGGIVGEHEVMISAFGHLLDAAKGTVDIEKLRNLYLLIEYRMRSD